ncbi:MAG: hypothetical protein HYY50_04130 [Candidatus Kerfeldbacteria bacterium]|nr:hypothetical protein [Candidatus Kerfeldbacteria bacterium]
MTKSLTGRTLSFVLREVIGEILYFPVWWYSDGLRLTWRRTVRQWWGMVDRLGLRFLIINIGKPMYADYSRSGRIISFFFRLLLIGWSLAVLTVWSGVIVFLFLLWLLVPVVAVGMLIRQLIPA